MPRDLDPDRRRFLAATGRAAALCAAAPLVHALAGCSDGAEQEAAGPRLRVPLTDLPESGRTVHRLGPDPVELLREGDRVTARSLICTHQGCEVAWRPDEREYFCPCHHGRFDAEGRPIYGPPSRPLRTLPVRVEDGTVIVGG